MGKFKVAILGNLNESYLPHYTMNTVFSDFQQSFPFEFKWVPTESLTENVADKLNTYSGIVAGSGPYTSKDGVINGIRHARLNNIPFFGTCSGFGYAVLECAQSFFNLADVQHPHDNNLPENEVFLQQLNVCGIGMHSIGFNPVKETLASIIYNNQELVHEESHCMYGVSYNMIEKFKDHGLIVSGTDSDGEPKILEYAKNDFFVITLFLPQLKSTLANPHPLILMFLQSAMKKVLSAV